MSKEPVSSALSSPRVDLHSHSHYSDGQYSPRDMAQKASLAGVTAMALTDHDCLDGLVEFQAAADGFEPVAGVEMSARYQNADVHILGLFVDTEDQDLADRLRNLAKQRETRTKAMVSRLVDYGLELTEADVKKHWGSGTVGRPHIALALVEKGFVGTVDEAFRKFLRPGGPGFVSRPGPEPQEAISWIHAARGVAVLAHPVLLRHRKWIEKFADAGLDGIEVWHPRHSFHDRETFLRVATRLDLVPSGGSDYHGPDLGDAEVGQEPVPLESLERLRQRRPRS